MQNQKKIKVKIRVNKNYISPFPLPPHKNKAKWDSFVKLHKQWPGILVGCSHCPVTLYFYLVTHIMYRVVCSAEAREMWCCNAYAAYVDIDQFPFRHGLFWHQLSSLNLLCMPTFAGGRCYHWQCSIQQQTANHAKENENQSTNYWWLWDQARGKGIRQRASAASRIKSKQGKTRQNKAKVDGTQTTKKKLSSKNQQQRWQRQKFEDSPLTREPEPKSSPLHLQRPIAGRRVMGTRR